MGLAALARERESHATEPLSSFQSYDAQAELKNFYKVLSTNRDGKLQFVSTMEGKGAATMPSGRSLSDPLPLTARHYPIYGTQWHPEKNAFEFNRNYVPHSPQAVRTSSYAAEFFVNEGRRRRGAAQPDPRARVHLPPQPGRMDTLSGLRRTNGRR